MYILAIRTPSMVDWSRAKLYISLPDEVVISLFLISKAVFKFRHGLRKSDNNLDKSIDIERGNKHIAHLIDI